MITKESAVMMHVIPRHGHVSPDTSYFRQLWNYVHRRFLWFHAVS